MENFISVDSIKDISEERARLDQKVKDAIVTGSIADIRLAIAERNQFHDQFAPPPIHNEGPALITELVESRARRVITYQS